jgi:hypothetical protein
MRLAILVLCICGTALIAGCTAPGSSIEVKEAPAGSLNPYKIVAVEATTGDADFDSNQVNFLTISIIDRLRESGRFDKVYDSTSSTEHDANLKLSVLVEFVLVYNVKSIESSVALTDITDGKTLAAALVNAHSESAFLGGKMTNAIAKLSDQIVDFATQRKTNPSTDQSPR